MSRNLYQQFVDAALSQQGAPYIWGGKGNLLFKDGKLVKHKFVKPKDPQSIIDVFDCSGLVTWALNLITMGKVDLRGTHSAKTILDTFPLVEHSSEDGNLILYPSHVSIDLGRGRVVDAHRGDSSTLSLLDALNANAKVEAHRIVRPAHTVLGYRRIPLDKSELRSV